MEARESAGAMRSRKEVNWEKTTDLVVGKAVRRDFSWPTNAAILAEESVPMRRRVIRGRLLEVGVLLGGGVAE